MADVEAQSTLSVEIQGEDAINRLAQALANLQSQAAQVQQAVAAAPSRITPAAAQRQLQQGYIEGLKAFDDAAGKLTYTLFFGASRGLRNAFDVVRSTASVAGRAVSAFAGPLGQVASAGGPAATAVIGVGIAVAGLATPLISFIAGLKLLRSSFGWAQEAAEEQLRIAGRTRRFFPQLIGEAVEGAEREMEVRMGVASALFGEAADSMQEQITRRFTAFRMGRGLRGERDIFARWGITPENVARFEKIAGTRIDVSGWLQQFVLKREELEERLSKAQSPQEKGMLEYKLGVIVDDTTKLFGQKFADTMASMTSRDLGRLNANIRAAIPLGYVEDATRRSRDFQIGLQSIKATFAAITKGIGGDVQPAITDFLGALNRKLLDTAEGGEGLGRAFRNLGSEMANKAWKALEDIMGRIDVARVNRWIDIIANEWKPAETAVTIRNLISGVLSFGRAVGTLVTTVREFIEAWPSWEKIKQGIKGPNIWDWLRSRKGAEQTSQTGGERAATFAERFGGGAAGGGGEAPSGEGFGTLGPGLGAGAGLPGPGAAAAGPGGPTGPGPGPAATGPEATTPGPPTGPGATGGTTAAAPGAPEVPITRGQAGPPTPTARPAEAPTPPSAVTPAAPAPAPTAAPGAAGAAAAPGAAPAAATAPPAPPPGPAAQPPAAQPPAAVTAEGAPTTAASGPSPAAPPGPAATPPTPPTMPGPAATGPTMPALTDTAPAGGALPTPTQPEKRGWFGKGGRLDPRTWFGGQAQAAEAPATGGTAPAPVTAASGEPAPSGPETEAAIPPAARPTSATGRVSQETMDTITGAASGRAAGLMTADLKSTSHGDALVMKAGFVPSEEQVKKAIPGALSFAGTAAGALVPGALGGAIEATTHGALYGASGATPADVLRETIPGMGILGAMKRDAEQGHPVRTYLREMLGIQDPGEPAPWQRGWRDEQAAALTAPFGERWGDWGGGITAEDGTNFGTAAGEALRTTISGLSIGGTPSTSYGVAPRSAPKNLGGDTPTEA